MFACGYLLSTLLRGVTAAPPYFTQEFSVTPTIGIASRIIFFWLCLLQLPIGILLTAMCAWSWFGLCWWPRCPVCCLRWRHPITGYFGPAFAVLASVRLIAPNCQKRGIHALQQRINAWLLMTGSLGWFWEHCLPSLASYFGWRSVFQY